MSCPGYWGSSGQPSNQDFLVIGIIISHLNTLPWVSAITIWQGSSLFSTGSKCYFALYIFLVPKKCMQPTTTKRTVQHGGGAFIPCVWEIQCKEDCIDEVKRRIELAIAEMESEGWDMAIEVSHPIFSIYGQRVTEGGSRTFSILLFLFHSDES